jgi:hypothetical protein
MRLRWASTISTGETFLERMLAVISAMVEKVEMSVITGSARVFVHEMRVKLEAMRRASVKIK